MSKPGKRRLFYTRANRRIFSCINRLHRNQNSYLRRDLNHPSISRQARSRLSQSGGADAFHWMRILRPLGHSKSISHSWLGEQNRSFADVSPEVVDAFLAHNGKQGWGRVTVAPSAEALRAFFLQAAVRGWPSAGIAASGRLVAEGFSLKEIKEIGDHLGHRSAYATRIYAKMDLMGLREVANFDLGGLK